jgi:hypothetical protein
MITVPTGQKDLLRFATELIEQCRVSVGSRGAYYRQLNVIAETGRYDNSKALINLLNSHLARAAAHIFSPVELKFSVDYDNLYPKRDLERAKVVAKQVTRQWDRSNTDALFGRGVFEALKYGACIMKQWVQSEGKEETPHYYAKLVMPWQFGVYNESENDIHRQIALCETSMLTLPEVWRRIWHMPKADKLFERISSHSSTGQAMSEQQSTFHQILSTSQLQTGVNGSTGARPGGIIQIGNDANFGIMGPQVAAATVQVHELWVQDDDDYTTILLIAPDIIISPPMMDGKLMKKSNLLGVPGVQPYRLIQPNEVTNWFWGRSELSDLIEPQAFLAMLCDDMRRLIGLQVDKIIFFSGENRITDELYGQMRAAGFGSLDSNTKVEDVTPKFPAELLEVIKYTEGEINTLGQFPDIMQGKGESGVRAGVHANTLLKTASPTLRDRSLLAERQCAVCADLTLTLKEAKDDSTYWTKADTPTDVNETQFRIVDLPADWRVTVDSHSSSPIFLDDNIQLIMAMHAKGIVQTDYVVDNVPMPNREEAKAQNAEAAKAKKQQIAELMQQNPEVAEKVLVKQMTGGRR